MLHNDAITTAQHATLCRSLRGDRMAQTPHDIVTAGDGMSPKTINRLRWASRILTGLAGLAAILVAADVGPAVHRWAALAVAVLGYGARWCEQQIPPTEKTARRPPAGPAAVMIVALLALSSASCRPYEAAWRTVAGVQAAGNVADKAIASAARRQIATCLGRHGKGSPQYKPCVEESRPWKALQHWRSTAVPAVNSATLATVAALQIAEQTKSRDKVDWIAALKPAICALARVVRQWGSVLGSSKTTVMVAVSAAEGVTCDR